MGTEDKFVNYPDWLVKALIQFNRHTTCMNEWELMDVQAVDLHRQPDLPQRLDVLFDSLQDGFGREVLVIGNFLALGYDTDVGTRVFPRFVEFSQNAQAMLEWRKEDDDSTIEAFQQVRDRLKKINHPEGTRELIIQIPYFIQKVEKYAPNGEISFREFQQRFDERRVVYTGVNRITLDVDVRKWLGSHPAKSYEQRFLFTLGFLVTNGIADKITESQIQESIGFFIGAFLSWAGMGVADSTRYMMAAAAARLAHYSHEFLKPFGELKDIMTKHSLPPELKDKLDLVLANVKVLELSNIAAGFSPNYSSFKTLLTRALRQNTNLSPEEAIESGGYDFCLTIGDVVGRNIHIEFTNLPADKLSIRFDPSFFDRLVRNLLRNAAQHSKTQDQVVRINLSCEIDTNYNILTMRFKHVGSTIKRQVTRLLFRMPVSHSDSSIGATLSPSKGIGLWTVGMAFEAQRLPLPEVRQETDGVSFIFRFPMKAS